MKNCNEISTFSRTTVAFLCLVLYSNGRSVDVMLFAVAWLVRVEHVTRDGKLCDVRESARGPNAAQ